MIYDVNNQEVLKPFDVQPAPEKHLSFLSLFNLIFSIIFFLPTILFVLIKNGFQVIRNIEKIVKRSDLEKRADQYQGDFDYQNINIDLKEDPKNQQFIYSMNYDGLKGFVFLTRKQFSEKNSSTLVVLGEGEVKNQDSGFHAHGEDYFPDFPGPLIVGISEGLMSVQNGYQLYASLTCWEKVLKELEEIAVNRVPKRIVLDKYQVGWCDPKSIGRFVIDYIPEFILSNAERERQKSKK